MKTLYKIQIILIALLSFNFAFAGSNNTNSPTNTSQNATIEAKFANNNKSVWVSTYQANNKSVIDQVVINFVDGSQQKISNVNRKNINVTGTGLFNNVDIIGVWVASNNNNPLTVDDSSGYGDYIMNTDAAYAANENHDFQADRGNPNAPHACKGKVLICHVPKGKPENRHTIYVSCNAAKAHIDRHGGDYYGECEEGGGGVIPVELVNFNAKAITPEMVKLSWTTASEVNNDYIAIEKTSDLNSWEPVCKVHGKGNSTEMNHYSCVDSAAHSGGQSTVYYRPKQVDFNGTYEYFNIIKLRLENASQVNEVESVYPNPATDRIKIQYKAAENGIVKIRLMSIEGKAILVSSYNAKQGSQIVDVDLPENNLAKGLYVLEVESDGQLYRQKVYKQ
jgi:hypothetical protein